MIIYPSLNSSVASDQRIKVVRIIGGSDLINTILLGIPVAWCDRPWFTRASDTLVHSETRRVSSRIFCWVHGVIVLMWSYVNYNINGYSKRERNVMRIISFLKGWEPENRNIFFFVHYFRMISKHNKNKFLHGRYQHCWWVHMSCHDVLEKKRNNDLKGKYFRSNEMLFFVRKRIINIFQSFFTNF